VNYIIIDINIITISVLVSAVSSMYWSCQIKTQQW